MSALDDYRYSLIRAGQTAAGKVPNRVLRLFHKALSIRRCCQQWEARYEIILHEHDPAHMELLLEELIPLLEESVRETRDPHIAALYQRACSFYGHLFSHELDDLAEYDTQDALDSF